MKRLKIILIGDSNAGKSAFINVYLGYEFKDNILPTIGIEKLEKKMEMEDGNEVKVIFWDTAGQSRCEYVIFCFLRNSDGVAIFYDITRRNTFEGVEYWYNRIREYGCNIPVILIACKSDLDKERKISKEEGEKYANERNMSFIETSSKKYINMDEAIDKIVKNAYK